MSLDPQILELSVSDLARGGAGVAKSADGLVVFVPFTAPGDRIRARIVKKEKRYAQADLVEVIEPSPLRNKPRCPVFGECGGCQWQHLPYEVQWKTKSQGVLHALRRLQVPLPEIREELPAEHIWEYRNRIQLRGFGRELGFFAPRTRDLVPIERCEIARPEINASIAEARQELTHLKKPSKVEIEVLPNQKVLRTWNAPHAAAGFRQIHDEQNLKLQKWVFENLSTGNTLLDLFGGNGNLSLPVVSKMKHIHCIDLSSPTKSDVPANFSFHKASVLTWLLKHSPENQEPVSAIVDPPREGLEMDLPEIAKALEKWNARELIAVGCDPDSWSRDIHRWIQRGWKLEKMAVLDLFPQTIHVESLALLRHS